MRWRVHEIEVQPDWAQKGPGPETEVFVQLTAEEIAQGGAWRVFELSRVQLAPTVAVSSGPFGPQPPQPTAESRLVPGWVLNNNPPEGLRVPVAPFQVLPFAANAFAAGIQWALEMAQQLPVEPALSSGVLLLGSEELPQTGGVFRQPVRVWIGLAVH